MSVTLTELIEGVNSELENRIIAGSAEVTGDGKSSVFLIAPPGRRIVNDAYFSVFINDVATTAYTMDFDSGECTMVSIPATTDEVAWSFNYVYWPETLVITAINAGINALFPHFYVPTATAVAVVGYEYDMSATTEFVASIDSSTSATGPWKKLSPSRYEVFYDDGGTVVRFYVTPSSGYIRPHCICRPTELALAADTLETTSGLPARAQVPITSYACYYLLSQKVAPRTRSDISVATTGTGYLSPRQMNDATNSFYLRFQMQVASSKMRPWHS